VEVGHGSDQQIVQSGGQHTEAPAVLIRNGAQTVGVAQTDGDGLGIDSHGKAAAQQGGDPAKEETGHHITCHNGPDVGRMGTGVAAGQHTEDNAESNAVEGNTDGVVVCQDHQTVYAHIHQHHGVAVLAGEGGDLVGILQQDPVILGSAAQDKGKDDAQAEYHAAEDIHRHLGSKFAGEGGGIGGGGQSKADGLVQRCVQEESGHADGQRGGVQAETLMYLGSVGQTCGQEEADDQAYENRQTCAQNVEANGLCVGIAEQQIGDQRRNAGGEHHGVDKAAQLFTLDEGIQTYAQHGGDAVERVDAPGAKAQGEDEGQSGDIVGLGLENNQQDQAHQAHHSHVEEGGCIAAQPEIVGGDLAGGGQDLDPAGEDGAAIRHAEGCHQEAQGQKAEEQLQKIGFGEVFDLFHITPRK